MTAARIKPPRPVNTVARISKGHASELRVMISAWKGVRKVELRDYSSMFPGTFFPAGPGVTLDIEQLPHLIAALQKASEAAR